jgi:hypothetical protein
MPIETLFLAALVIFLCFPVELYKKSPEGGLRVMYFVAGFTASYSFSFTVANSPHVLGYVTLITGNDALVASIAEIQARARHYLSLGHEGLLPMVVVLAIFISALSYLLWIRKQPGGAPAAVAA